MDNRRHRIVAALRAAPTFDRGIRKGISRLLEP